MRNLVAMSWLLPVLMSTGCLSLGAAEATALVNANTAFAVDLYKKESTAAANLFFSPFSLSTALGMTYTGARGQTAEEMARTLHFPLRPGELGPAFAALTRRLQEISARKEVQLRLANSLWCQADFSFLPEFLRVDRECYDAEARLVDFMGKAEAAQQEINSWVANATENKIQDLLHPEDIKRNTRLVLCNAVYFKGEWMNRFETNATQAAPFFVAGDRQVQAQLMSKTMNLKAREFDEFNLFTLPYTSNELSMVVLLPKAKDGLRALEQRIDAAGLTQWLNAVDQAPETKATVFLPKFKLNCRLMLARDLTAMGMPTAFSAAADFSGITGRRDLAISDVIHQGFVDVNEQGTEAAAATAVVMVKTAVVRPMPIFRADHPFIFLIRENQTGSILFLGRVTDPSR